MTRTPHQDDEDDVEDYSPPYMVIRGIISLLLLGLLIWSLFKYGRNKDRDIIDPARREGNACYCRHKA